MRIHVCLFDSTCRKYGVRSEIDIFTRKRHWLIRLFSKAQAYDWKRGCWTGVIDADRWEFGDNFDHDQIMWKHIVSSPRAS